MVIPHHKQLKDQAYHALSRGREPQKLVTGYAGASTGIVLVLTLLNYWLDLQIDQTGGLSNLGTRSILSTAQTILPIIQSVLLMCLELGYLSGMMRIARGQYADHTDLKVGFQRFWPLLRMTLLQGLLYGAIGILTLTLSVQIYLFTPWADTLVEVLLPYVNSSVDAMDAAALSQAMSAMIPMMILYVVLFLVVMIPVSYRFRMANYALLDDPKGGAMAALRSSRHLMRRNCLKLAKVDLSFWWYYLLSLLVSLVSYGDVLLALVGVELPMNSTVSFFLFYFLYLAAFFALNYFLRNRVECSYIMAYEAIREKPRDDGVVLGNIFDM